MSAAMASLRQAGARRRLQANQMAPAAGAGMRALPVCFRSRQCMTVHRPAIDLAVPGGDGCTVTAEQEERLAPAVVTFMTAGEAVGTQADSRMAALSGIAPPPSGAGHTAAMRRCWKGAWR